MCEAVIDCPHSTPVWTKSGYVVLRNQNIKDGRLDLSEPSFTDEEHFKQRIRRMAPRPGDIVITREAPMGEVCKIPEGLTCCLGQRQVLLRPKADVDGDYLLYALQSTFVQNQIRWNEGTGSTVSNIRIPVLEKIKIPRHDQAETSIAKALGALDSKIDLNRRINQALEAMAQAIFKSWFVDFDPVKAKIDAIEQGQDPLRAAMRAISGKTDAELDQMPRKQYDQLSATAALFPNAMEDSKLGGIPKGWKAGALAELCQLNPENWSAKTLPGAIRYVDLANTKRGEITGVQNIGGKEIPSRARRVLRYGDTVVGTVRPGNRSFALVGEDGLTGSTGFAALRPKELHWLEFVYLVATSEVNIERLAHLADGGAYPAVRPEIVVQEDVVLPIQSVAREFSRIVQPLFAIIQKKRKGGILLADLRDTLLPKLLSGELSVEALAGEIAQ